MDLTIKLVRISHTVSYILYVRNGHHCDNKLVMKLKCFTDWKLY